MMNWLKEEFVPYEAIYELFSIQREDEALWGGFRLWANGLRRPREVIRGDFVNRHGFESYLQQNSLLPIKIASARVGMSMDSFNALLGAIESIGMIPYAASGISRQVIPESHLRSLRTIFPELRQGIFGGHSNYCKALHNAIRSNFSIVIEPLFCITSHSIREDPVAYAYDYDCLSGDPVGLKYQVWLDFGKPINLRPDVCSTKLFNERRSELTPFLMADRIPDIPDGLGEV